MLTITTAAVVAAAAGGGITILLVLYLSDWIWKLFVFYLNI